MAKRPPTEADSVHLAAELSDQFFKFPNVLLHEGFGLFGSGVIVGSVVSLVARHGGTWFLTGELRKRAEK